MQMNVFSILRRQFDSPLFYCLFVLFSVVGFSVAGEPPVKTPPGVAEKTSDGEASAQAKKAESGAFRVALIGLKTSYADQTSLGLFDEEAEDFPAFLARLHAVAKDETIDAVLLDASAAAAPFNYAQMEEVGCALAKVKKAGKKVCGHFLEAGGPLYAALCQADLLTIETLGSLNLVGVRLELYHVKGFLDWLGAEADLLRCGAFKSAGEPLTLTEPSPETRLEYNALVAELFAQLTAAVSAGRRLPPETVVTLINEGPFTAKDALRRGLVDHVRTRAELNEVYEKVFARRLEWLGNYGAKSPKSLNFSNPLVLFAQLFGSGAKTAAKPHIAVLTAVGTIMDGRESPSPFGSGGVYALDFAQTVRQLAADDNVLGVVLRVDSPGGSASASEQIASALTSLKGKKPLAVSMSATAASGGYYISAPGDRIFALPSTLTGSIGVIGGKITMRKTLDKLGINVATFQQGKQAGIFSGVRKFDEGERRTIQRSMDEVYERFLEVVAKGRGRQRAEIEPLAHGRVWTGSQAVKNGLADELGGLNEAVAWLRGQIEAEDAGLLPTVAYPKRKPFFERLAQGAVVLSPSGVQVADQALCRPLTEAASLWNLLPKELRPLGPALAVLLEKSGEPFVWTWHAPVSAMR
jgi:protease-4